MLSNYYRNYATCRTSHGKILSSAQTDSLTGNMQTHTIRGIQIETSHFAFGPNISLICVCPIKFKDWD